MAKKSVAAVPESGDLRDAMISKINAAHGAGHAQYLSSSGLSIHIPGVLSTGDPWLDWAMGRGGVPLARMGLLGGDEGSGKTTIALRLCASVQRMGGIAFYIDAEYKLDAGYAETLGVNLDELILSQPDYLEQALKIVEDALELIGKHKETTGISIPVCIIFDSISSLPSKLELESEHGGRNHGDAARVMSLGLKKLAKAVSLHSAAFVMISQLRVDQGVKFGDPHVTALGKAPLFYSAWIARLQPGGQVKDGDDRAGTFVEAKIIKNQVAPPFKKCKMMMRFGVGCDKAYSLLKIGEQLGLVKQGGSWFTWESTGDKWNGEAAGREGFDADPGLVVKLEKELRQHYGAM